jgi:NADP-dependent aldehyde dehydrogenase
MMAGRQFNAATANERRNKMEQALHTESSLAQIDGAARAASAAAPQWACTPGRPRAALLRALAQALEAERNHLVELANEETALGSARLNSELDRTAFQLRAFADAVEAGEPYPAVEDAALPGAPPAGRPHLLRIAVPLGPVAMFAASNFPFAFSVLGGDTASALAAGCPVVIKAHPAHAHLSRAVFELARKVVQDSGLPSGLLTMVQGSSNEVGVRLVHHPDIAAVAFTGSFAGGSALHREVNSRARPIPFFGELGSVNPIIAMPAALAKQGPQLASALAASIVQGAGQFCTSPGVLLVPESEHTDSFIGTLAELLDAHDTHAMLSPGIRRAFDEGVARVCSHASAKRLTQMQSRPENRPAPGLVQIDIDAFLAEPDLREEVFGPFCVVLRARSLEQVDEALKAIGGSLTVTLWGADSDTAETRRLVRSAMNIAGRVLFAGVPTGVAVTRAQQHGGPWPSSTQPQTTSIGLAAMQRFLRPVALQDAPDWLVQREGVPC